MAAHLPHAMFHRTLWILALRYAQALEPGDELHDDIDGRYVAPFRHLLDLALEVHGLRMVPIDHWCGQSRSAPAGVESWANDPRPWPLRFCSEACRDAGRHVAGIWVIRKLKQETGA